MTETFWLLQYDNGPVRVFVGHDNGSTMEPVQALKFRSEKAALEHLRENPQLFLYTPIRREFEFSEERMRSHREVP